MQTSHHTKNAGRLVAWASATVLVSASIGFATPAFAEQSDTGQAHSAQGQAHKQANKPADHPSGPQSGQGAEAPPAGNGNDSDHPAPAQGGGSDVSLPRPNEFQAQADPDGMENGGVDQPGGEGGVDTTTQDGNNGSGNDTDCEDDNRGVGVPGHCKDRPGTVTPPVDEDTPPETETPGDTDTDTPGDTDTDTPVVAPETPDQGEVLTPVVGPQGTTAPPAIQVMAPQVLAPASAPAQVTAAAPAAAPAVLPNTGAGQALLGLAIAGLAALAVGGGLVRQGRRANS